MGTKQTKSLYRDYIANSLGQHTPNKSSHMSFLFDRPVKVHREGGPFGWPSGLRAPSATPQLWALGVHGELRGSVS